jgi:hypothetical protein
MICMSSRSSESQMTEQIDPLIPLNSTEFRQVLPIGRTTAYRLIADGQLQVTKLGARSFVRRSELARFICALPTIGGKEGAK